MPESASALIRHPVSLCVPTPERHWIPALASLGRDDIQFDEWDGLSRTRNANPLDVKRPPEPEPVVHVAAGIVYDERGRVLVQKRPADAHVGGLWEFPGGKADPREGRRAALARELKEELDIEVLEARPLIQVKYAYPEKTVLLDVWRVERYSGTPKPLEDQPLKWLAPDELPALEMPPADRPIVNAVRLPPVCLITSDEPRDDKAFLSQLERRLADGIRLVQLRTRRSGERLSILARDAVALCEAHGAWLVLNGDPEQALASGAHGVHLSSTRLSRVSERPVPEDLWLSTACHDVQELQRAKAISADFVLASPVAKTVSHPDARPIGFEGLEMICQQATMPVYALGGLGINDRERAWQAGAQGVAGISGFW